MNATDNISSEDLDAEVDRRVILTFILQMIMERPGYDGSGSLKFFPERQLILDNEVPIHLSTSEAYLLSSALHGDMDEEDLKWVHDRGRTPVL